MSTIFFWFSSALAFLFIPLSSTFLTNELFLLFVFFSHYFPCFLAGIFALGVGVIFFYAVGVQIYLVMNQAKWDQHFRRQIM